MSQKRIMNTLGVAKLAILSLYWDWITYRRVSACLSPPSFFLRSRSSSQFQVFRIFKSNNSGYDGFGLFRGWRKISISLIGRCSRFPPRHSSRYGVAVHRDNNAEGAGHAVVAVGWRRWSKRDYVDPSLTQRNQLDLFKSPCARIVEQRSQVTHGGALRGPRGQGRIGFIFKPRRSIQQLLLGETEVVTIARVIAAELSNLLGHRGAA
jgi:hypothetical protein